MSQRLGFIWAWVTFNLSQFDSPVLLEIPIDYSDNHLLFETIHEHAAN